MKYYSTNKQAPVASLEEAVVKGLAGDKGLYMPEYIDSLDEEVIANMKNQSFHEIACTVAQMFFGEDIEPEVLDGIVKDTLSFETPVVPEGNIIRRITGKSACITREYAGKNSYCFHPRSPRWKIP